MREASLGARLNRLLTASRSLWSPPCPGCGGERRPPAHTLCDQCRERSQIGTGWLERRILVRGAPLLLCALGVYRGGAGSELTPVASLLRRFKYGRDRSAGRAICRTILDTPAISSLCGHDVVPIPLHASRLESRGFNQAAWLARAFASTHRGAIRPAALWRKSDDVPQAERSAIGRRTLAATSFVARRDAVTRGVVLFDDVRTTGTTLRRAAEACLDAGLPIRGAAVLLLAEPPRTIDDAPTHETHETRAPHSS